jgi:hypothetical protein
MSAQSLVLGLDGSSVVGAGEVPFFSPSVTFSPTSDDYAIVSAANGSLSILYGVGLWVSLATWIGDMDNRTNRASETDLLDIIKLGDLALEDGGPQQIEQGATLPVDYTPGGLWVKPRAGDGGTTWYRVTSLCGVSKGTRIGTEDLVSNDSTTWAIFLEPPAIAPVIRYYFDIMVEDVDN